MNSYNHNTDAFPAGLSDQPVPIDPNNGNFDMFDDDNDHYHNAHQSTNDVAFDMDQDFQQLHPNQMNAPTDTSREPHDHYFNSSDQPNLLHTASTNERRKLVQPHERYLGYDRSNEFLAYHQIDRSAIILRKTDTLKDIRKFISNNSRAHDQSRSDAKKSQRSNLKLVHPVIDLIHPVFSVHSSHYLIIVEKLRMVILWDRILIFDPDENHTRVFVYYMYQYIKDWKDKEEKRQNEPNYEAFEFEFMALEALLWYLLKNFDSDLSKIRSSVQALVPKQINELSYDLNTKSLEGLRYRRIELANLQSRAEEIKEVLDDLQNNAGKMYLTNPRTGQRQNDNHNEIKDLLDTYIDEIEDIGKRAKLSQERVEDNEKMVNVHLDTLRNQLLSMELRLSIFSLTCGVGGVIAGIFGMNLPMPLFDENVGPHAFYITIGIILVTVFGMTILCWVLLRRVLYSLY